MKKIFNHSIIGSANRGKEDILFESIDEIKNHYSGVEWEGVDFLKCELFTPKEDKIIGYVLSDNIGHNSLIFITVYEFEKNSFTLKPDFTIKQKNQLLNYLMQLGFNQPTIEQAFKICNNHGLSYINALSLCEQLIVTGSHILLEHEQRNEKYINKYFEIMKT